MGHPLNCRNMSVDVAELSPDSFYEAGHAPAQTETFLDSQEIN